MWYLIVSIPDICTLTYFSSLVIYFNSKPTSKKKHKEVIQYFTMCNQSTFTCNPKTILLFRQTIENVSFGVLTDKWDSSGIAYEHAQMKD